MWCWSHWLHSGEDISKLLHFQQTLIVASYATLYHVSQVPGRENVKNVIYFSRKQNLEIKCHSLPHYLQQQSRNFNSVSECCLLRLPINQNELWHYHGNNRNYDASEVIYSPGCSDASRVFLPTRLEAHLRNPSPVITDSKMCLHFHSEHWLLR